MFYVKDRLTDLSEVKIEITDSNVYTKCPACRKEISVDLVEVLKEGDLLGTSVFCEDCSVKLDNGEFGEVGKIQDYLSSVLSEGKR